MIEENKEKVLILDFGSQYAQLIARRVRRIMSSARSYHIRLLLKRYKRLTRGELSSAEALPVCT